MKIYLKWLTVALFVFSGAALAQQDVVGEVVTATNFVGPNHTIGVVRFQDPKIPNAWCYLASAQAGGFAANFGMQEDPSEYTVDCFTTGPVSLPQGLLDKEVIRRSNRSLILKELKVVRFVDHLTHRLVYVVYTRRLFDGSPKNAMSSVPYQP